MLILEVDVEVEEALFYVVHNNNERARAHRKRKQRTNNRFRRYASRALLWHILLK